MVAALTLLGRDDVSFQVSFLFFFLSLLFFFSYSIFFFPQAQLGAVKLVQCLAPIGLRKEHVISNYHSFSAARLARLLVLSRARKLPTSSSDSVDDYSLQGISRLVF